MKKSFMLSANTKVHETEHAMRISSHIRAFSSVYTLKEQIYTTADRTNKENAIRVMKIDSLVEAAKPFIIVSESLGPRMHQKVKQSSGKSDKSASTNGCENVTQYLLSSSLHGLRYIGTTSLSVFERLFFSLSFLMVVSLAAYFISNVWQKWKETPVIWLHFHSP
jgi:Amiloride-sensitive sodium channel